MRAPIPPRRPLILRHGPSVLLLSVLAAGGWFSVQLAAHDPPRQPPVEEEDPSPRPLKKVPPVEGEAPPRPDTGPARNAPPVPTELLRDSQAPGLEEPIRKLYHDLAIPHDEVTLTDGTTKNVRPLKHYLGPGSSYPGEKVALYYYDNQKLVGLSETVDRKKIRAVKHYEDLALEQVKDFLKGGSAVSPVPELNTQRVSPERKLEAAEKVLAVALHFHQNAPERKADEDPGWKRLGDRLRRQLVETRLEQLKAFARGGDWEHALKMAAKLKREADAKVRQEVGQQLAGLVEQPLGQKHYDEVHRRLRDLEKEFPDNPAVRAVPERLRREAEALLEQARQAQQQNRLTGDYPILGVGVRDLPERMSPATAVTDSERWAVELIFESLVRPFQNGSGGTTYYVPGLATGLPRRTPRGRVFQLDREAYWPDTVAARGQNPPRVTEADVRLTVELLRKNSWAGYVPEGADLLEAPAPEPGSGRVTLALRQGFLDPLSLMTFKVLPAAAGLSRPLEDLTDEEFAKHPIGSGPFQLADRERQGGAVVFVANPSFQRVDPHTGKSRTPQIREIRFFRSENPVDDFNQGRLHLLINPPRSSLQVLRSLFTPQALPNRRIYFLAVNHRKQVLQNPALRKAIAHAIDRETILAEVFRKHLEDLKPVPHRALTGPFPPDAWAGQKSPAPSDLYQPPLARKEAAEFKNVKLTLKYPRSEAPAAGGAEDVEEACNRIREQVKQETGIELELIPRTPHQLHRDVEGEHNYDLAYYSYDYPSEMYWLWPLFDTDRRALEQPNGRNYLGYQNDGELASDFQSAMLHRDFEKVRGLTYRIQTQLTEKMPFIPLWQLDTIVVTHGGLKTTYLDPLLIFTDVEHWQLKK